MKLKNINNFRKEFSKDDIINKKRETKTIDYIEKLNLKCESNVIKNPSEKFKLYKSNPVKQFFFSLFSELDALEKLFISNFIKEMKRKTENEIRDFFPKKKKEYEDRIELILTKAKKEIISNQDVIKNLKEKNSKLNNKLMMMKNQNEMINEELKEAEISIKMLNEKNKLYLELQNSYEHFAPGFKYKEKDNNIKNNLDIPKEFKINKDILDDVREELKEKKNQISKLKQEMIQEENNNRNNNYQLYNEFFDLDENNNIIEEQNKKKLLSIKEDINTNKLIIKENDNIQKIFISVFNLFYKNLNLERNLIKNAKNINLIKTDYTPKIFNLEEVVNYIYLMIYNSKDESCFDLLKDIVSYIYMILRDIGGGLHNNKYDPVVAVNEIEKNLISIQNENELLSEKINDIKNQIIDENESIKKLNKQIENINKINEELQKAIKFVNVNSKDNKNIRKSFSATSFKYNKNKMKFQKLNKKLEKQIENEKVPYFKDNLDNLINRINRLYFHRIKEKKFIENYSYDRYSNVKRRMNKKINKLKKLKNYNRNFFTVENTLSSNINRNIDTLILNIQKKYNID